MRFSIFLSVLLLTAYCAGQVPEKYFSPLATNYSINQGLTSNECYQVFQDSKKRIWVATDFGVSLFNAGSFKTYTTTDGLIDDTVFEFYEDPKGNIWFLSSSKELCYFNGKEIVKYRYNNLLTKHVTSSVVPDKIILVDHEGNLFYSIRNSGVFKIDSKGSIERISKNPNSINVLQIGNEKIWEVWNKFYRRPVHFDIRVESKQGSTTIGNIHYTGKICFDQSKKLLITEKEVFDIDTKESIYKGEGLISGRIQNSYVYLGTRVNGLLKYNLKTRVVEDTILQNQSVTSCEFDYQGGMWCTTLQNGLYYFPKNGFSLFRPLGEKIWVSDIEYFEKKLYIGLLSSQWIEFENSILYHNNPSSAHTRFYTTPFGIVRTDGSGFYLNDKFINFFWTDRIWSDSNEIIVGTSDIYRVKRDGSYEMIYDFFKDSVFKRKFLTTDILKDNDRIWLGSKQGLYYIQNGKANSLTNSEVYSGVNVLAYDEKWGRILGSSKKGLLFFDYSGKLKDIDPSIKTIGRKIIDLLIDNQNRLIVATEKGLFVLTRTKNKINYSSLGRNDLFNSNQTTSITLMGNKLVVGTVHGVYTIDYLKVLNTNVKNYIELTSVESTLKNQKKVSYQKQGLFDYNATLIINFQSLDFESNPKFKYRLNNNEPWIETTQKSVLINNIREGNFTMEISQEKRNGLWSDPKKIFEFKVKTPFWKTLWFLSISIVIGVVLILFVGLILGRRRIKRLEIKNRMLLAEHSALKAQMNPHFFYNILNSIQSKIMFNENEMALEYLSRFSKMSRMMIGNSRNSFHSLREEIEFLTQYLELENLRFKNNFTWDINKDRVEHLMNYDVPSMIIQPILENAIQHGFKNDRSDNSLIIEMTQYDENSLSVRILDNGRGYFPEKKRRKSIALTIIKERLELMSDSNYEYKIDIEPIVNDGEVDGTRVLVLLPLKNKAKIEED